MRIIVVLFIVIAATLLTGGGAFLWRNMNREVRTPVNRLKPPGAPGQPPSVTTSPVLVRYGVDGFGPKQLSLRRGQTLTIINNSGNPLQFNSDPHPEHTANQDLNAGYIAPGARRDLTPNRIGQFGFHNHLVPLDSGKLTVSP